MNLITAVLVINTAVKDFTDVRQ